MAASFVISGMPIRIAVPAMRQSKGSSKGSVRASLTSSQSNGWIRFGKRLIDVYTGLDDNRTLEHPLLSLRCLDELVVGLGIDDYGGSFAPSDGYSAARSFHFIDDGGEILSRLT